MHKKRQLSIVDVPKNADKQNLFEFHSNLNCLHQHLHGIHLLLNS